MKTDETGDSVYVGGSAQEAHDSGLAKGRVTARREAFEEMERVADRAFREGVVYGYEWGFEDGVQDARAAALKRWQDPR